MQIMRLSGGIFRDDTGCRLHYLLNVQPNERTGAYDFWARIVQNVLLDGNAYIVPVYNIMSMELDRLVLCGRGTVAHDTVNNTYTVDDISNGISGTYTEDGIIHIMNMSSPSDPQRGLGVIAYARTTLGIATAGDNETLKRFASGGNMRGIISNDAGVRGFGEVQDEQLEKAALDLDDKIDSGARFVSLPGSSIKMDTFTLSSADMQFLESRKFNVRDICRFFGVHPSFVFDDTSNNYKSAENANADFLTHTLNPMLRKIESEFQRKLIGEKSVNRRKFQFDRRGLFASDLETRMKYMAQALAVGRSVNELRMMDNLPPVEGGDVVLVSANLRTMGELTGANPTTIKPDSNE
jgi:HK97 family phage portal protein